MDLQCDLRGKTVYVPTTAKYDAGFWTVTEPVDVVSVSDTDGLRRAFERAHRAGNPVLPTPARHNRPPHFCVKYARVKSWGEYARGLNIWVIDDRDNAWSINGYQKSPHGGFKRDPEKKTTFPPGTSIDVVVDRMIAILQESAGVAPPGKTAD